MSGYYYTPDGEKRVEITPRDREILAELKDMVKEKDPPPPPREGPEEALRMLQEEIRVRMEIEAAAAFQRIAEAIRPAFAALRDAMEPVIAALGKVASYTMEEVMRALEEMLDAADETPPDDEDPPLRPVICMIWIYHAERLVELRKLYGQGVDEGPGRRPSQAQAAPCVYEGLRRPKQ